MTKSARQKHQERLYEQWKRQRDNKKSSDLDTGEPTNQISPSIQRQQPRVQEPDLVSATTSKTKAEERAANRAKYPEIAAFVDECRRVFGPDVKVVSITPRKDLAIPLPDATDDLDD